MTRTGAAVLLAAAMASNPALAQSQPASGGNRAGQQQGSGAQGVPGMGHATMGHSKMDHRSVDDPPVGRPLKASEIGKPHGQPGKGEQHGGMQGMTMGRMQGGEAPPDARDPNAYAEGARPANLGGNAMADESLFGRLIFDTAEVASGDGERGLSIDAEAWYGGDYNKLWMKAEGERSGGRLESLRTEALWDRAFAPFWSTQLGVRHDTGGGQSRNWLAFGVRGLAPYWFDTELTGYWRSGGVFAARVDVKYEILFTNRLILEPEFGMNLYSRDDPGRGIGEGLTDAELALRLRYEITRQFAPYVGVTWNRKFGDTARYARMHGEAAKTVQAVAGVRFWF